MRSGVQVDIHAADAAGVTVMHNAVHNGHDDVVQAEWARTKWCRPSGLGPSGAGQVG